MNSSSGAIGFATRSDSEIALHLYEECGAACLQRLRGEFAIALWDQPNQSLFAARDRFGIKPVFYAQHEGALYLASEVKALFAAGVPARWNREAVYYSLEFGGCQMRTLFHNVFQVPPPLSGGERIFAAAAGSTPYSAERSRSLIHPPR
jgi:asparagine synthase (glutamine-hydrolysing)